MQKKMTIEDLAGMVNKGFTGVQNSIDKRFDKMDERLSNVEGIQQDMLEEILVTHADVRYLRSGVDILTRNEAERDSAVKDLMARVHRLEQKAGLAK